MLKYRVLRAGDDEVPAGIEAGGGRGAAKVAHLPPRQRLNDEHLPSHPPTAPIASRPVRPETSRRVHGKPYAYDVSYFTLESTFCTYKSWHRPNRRYPGVYLDMFHDRIKKAEATWPEEDFGLFWDARKTYLPAHLLLEDNPDDVGSKPKKKKQNHYRLTGQVIAMDLDWPCFRNDYHQNKSAKTAAAQ